MSVFITGASSGLGEALAARYAAAGHTIGLLGRKADSLHALAARLPGEHHVYALDVRDRGALHAAARHFEQTAGPVDIVIASAGVSAGTLTGEPDDFEVFAEIFSTNVFAMMATFEPFIAGMTRRRAGTLVGISSVAGVRGLPGAGAYSASKSAVTTYCESLRLELAPRGVSVVTIAPGYVRRDDSQEPLTHAISHRCRNVCDSRRARDCAACILHRDSLADGHRCCHDALSAELGLRPSRGRCPP